MSLDAAQALCALLLQPDRTIAEYITSSCPLVDDARRGQHGVCETPCGDLVIAYLVDMGMSPADMLAVDASPLSASRVALHNSPHDVNDVHMAPLNPRLAVPPCGPSCPAGGHSLCPPKDDGYEPPAPG